MDIVAAKPSLLPSYVMKELANYLRRLPERKIAYDTLVLMALGSTSNDFNTPGVKEHCIFLDNPHPEARRFTRGCWTPNIRGIQLSGGRER